MKKLVILFGCISGGILSAMLLISMVLYKNGTMDFENGEIFGYTTMVIASSVTFFGIKAYRDRQLGGAISFGKAFQTGALIGLVATVFYVVTWEFNLAFFSPDFFAEYAQSQLERAVEKGQTQAEISALTERLGAMAGYYKNPFLRMAITATEILPVTLLVALICAAILRKKEPVPAR